MMIGNMEVADVTKRFVQAYYNLYQQRIVSSKKQFCDACDLLTTNFNLMSQGKRNVTTNHLCHLFQNFGVSPEWMFTGNGDFMLK